MNAADYIILLVLAVVVTWAVRRMLRKGSHCSGCEGCSHAACCRRDDNPSDGCTGKQ